MSSKILWVDDEMNVLLGVQRTLRGRFEIDTALSGKEGLEKIQSDGPYAVVVADMNMPGMNGVEMLQTARERAPDTVRIMLTGNVDQRTAAGAVNKGNVFHFLNKPCPPDELIRTLEDGVRQYHLVTAERELLEDTLNGSVKVLSDVLSMTDPAAFGQAKRVRELMLKFAAFLGSDNRWELELAATFSQIGLVAVPPAVLEKRRLGGRLAGSEIDMLGRVAEMGANLLANIPRLAAVAEIIRHQDKDFGGTATTPGSPERDLPPLGARMLKIAKQLAAEEERGNSAFVALEAMRLNRGCYDPVLLDKAAGCFTDDRGVQADQPPSNLRVSLSQLRITDRLLEAVTTADGMVVAGIGTEVTPIVMEKLVNFSQLTGLTEPLVVERTLPDDD